MRIYLAKGMPAPAAMVATGLARVVPWSMPARELAAEAMERQGDLGAALASGVAAWRA